MKIVTEQPILEFENFDEAYAGIIAMALGHGHEQEFSFHRKFMRLKPVSFIIRDTHRLYPILPFANYYAEVPWGWLLREAMDFFAGEDIPGGLSYYFDPIRQRRYPHANGEIDWSYKNSFGKRGWNQIEYIIKLLRHDKSDRGTMMSTWDRYRDLFDYHDRVANYRDKNDYVRYPCSVFFIFGVDDYDKYKLNLNVFTRAHSILTDFSCDVFRFSSMQHVIANRSFTKGYGGKLGFFMDRCQLQGDTKNGFRSTENLLRFWEDINLGHLHSDFPANTYVGGDAYGKVKTYDFFEKEFLKREAVDRLARRHSWSTAVDILEQIEYPLFKDWARSMLVSYYIEFKKNTKKLKRLDYATEVRQALAFEEKVGYNPIEKFFVETTNNFKLPLGVHILKWALKSQNEQICNMVIDQFSKYDNPYHIWSVAEALLYLSGKTRSRLLKEFVPKLLEEGPVSHVESLVKFFDKKQEGADTCAI